MEKTPQILIVDDDSIARQTTEMLLWPDGYQFHFAASGPEALVELDDMESEPDVILLDVMMPDMDGFELCQRLKRHPLWQHIPIILVTALDSKEDLARGLEAGADDFVHKPVNGLELRARVRSMLRIKQRHDELAATLRLRENLSNMIVHDLRSPLASIQIYCDLLEDKLAADGQEELDTIREEAGRLSSFITDMLLMAKMEHNQLILHRTSVNIKEVVQAVEKNYRAMAQLKGIEFIVTLPDGTPQLSLDATLWQRLLDNLLSNAFKFSPPGGTVQLQVEALSNERVKSSPDLPQLRVHVLDDGPGIPLEHHDTIFDKFKIVASGRRDITQVGLGLAFCKMVVEAHNGRISVTNNTPTGTIFTVEI